MKKTKKTDTTKFKHSKLEILEYIFMYIGILAMVSAIVINLIYN